VVKGKYTDDTKKTLRMETMVEKPKPEVAPSNLATPGRYIFRPEIFDALKTQLNEYFDCYVADIEDSSQDFDSMDFWEIYDTFAFRLKTLTEYKLNKI
jgi:NDP-sugar pyrophosphorylase family protein